MINIAQWDKEEPIVLKNQIYTFEKDLSTAKSEKIEDVGSFCMWELEIVNHEKEVWKKFLSSRRTGKDLDNYLFNKIKGDL